jgi:hypothetical protein
VFPLYLSSSSSEHGYANGHPALKIVEYFWTKLILNEILAFLTVPCILYHSTRRVLLGAKSFGFYLTPKPLLLEEEVEMDKKRNFIVACILIILLVGCGGSNTTPEPESPGTGGQNSSTSADDSTAAPEEAEAEPTADITEEEPAAESPAEEEPVAEPAADDANQIAGRPTSGIDPDTGLEINPSQIVPGVDFIVRGTMISFNMTPQTNPEFLIEAPDGTRYRVQSQPVPEIAFEDGTVLLAHQYQRGMFAQATVRQEEGSGVTSVVTSDDLTLLSNE